MYLEKNTRFANSKLWSLQKAAYSQFGPQAWDKKKVPSYITSSPLIARAYAQITLGFIRDGLSPQAILPIDPSQPLYLFDLGAGTGRFGFLYLNQLLTLLDQLNIPLRLCYVMTDISLKSLEYLENHNYLKSFKKNLEYKKSPCLDFCLFQHDQEEQVLFLRQRKNTLHSRLVNNPLILIANYFFDTIPHDLFRVHQHKLEEGRISLSYSLPKEFPGMDPDNPLIIPHLKMQHHYEPIDNFDAEYLDQPLWMEILNEYALQQEQIPQMLFPLGAMQVIQRFLKLSQNKFLLLAGDQGIHSTTQLQDPVPFFSQHDTFSIQVNYHAIASYFKKINGGCLTTLSLHPSLVNIAAISKGAPSQFPELFLAFKQNLEAFELSDYVRLANAVIELGDSASLDIILKLIKLGNYDPCDFNVFFPRFMQEAAKLHPKVCDELLNLITQVGKHFYPLSAEGGAFVMNLGVLCYPLKSYKQALYYFQKALELGYSDPLVFKNITAVRAKL